MTLFDAAAEIGGQFNLARRIPGKEEFAETLRYFRTRLAKLGVEQRLNRRAGVEELRGFDNVILSSGIVPRRPPIPGLDHPKVAGYVEIVEGRKRAGKRVAIVGAGGIGFDVAELLTEDHPADGHASDGSRDDAGLHIRIDGKPQLLEVDTIVICAGQEPRRELVASLQAAGITPRLIGGAAVALELDAKRAIDQGTRVALAL